MKVLITVVAAMAFVTAVGAQDLGNQAPAKVPQIYPVNIPDPLRQGGDTIANATVIPGLPFGDAGTTAGYTDDYSATCYFAGGAPDVVYQYTAQAGVVGLDISLCGTSYDSGLFVYDAGLNQIACNDDYCGLQSQLDFVPMVAGSTYYIVVDGYSSANGAYSLSVGGLVSCCYYPIPDTEGEPPLVADYVDTHNGGCNTPPEFPFQEIVGDTAGEALFSGSSGWYVSGGANFRDTDWFLLTMGAQGAIEVTFCSTYATYLFELGPQDCEAVAVVQQATAPICIETSMIISGYAPLAPVWFWVGPTVFAAPGPDDEYGYNLRLSGLAEPVSAEAATWSSVKALYD